MFSGLTPFQSIIELVKDDTGIEITKNLYPKIRRFIYRAEKDIGFGGTTILKRVKYSVTAGTIIQTEKNAKLRLPPDILYLEAIGTCSEGVCPGDYQIQGDWLFFRGTFVPEGFNLVYYALLSDGEGNPVTTENHSEAVVAGIVYWLYKASVFRNKGSNSLLAYYENYYHDRIGEARGDDAMPSTDAEWTKLAQLMNMSSKDVLLYSESGGCFGAIPEDTLPVYDPDTGELGVIGTSPGQVLPAVDNQGTTNGGDGTGASIDGDGSYPDPDYVPPVDPDPEPGVNQPPSMGDINIDVTAGTFTTITLDYFMENADPAYSDFENDPIHSVRIDAINPNNSGTFYFDGQELQELVVITRDDLYYEKLGHLGIDPFDIQTDSLSFSIRDKIDGIWVSI